MRRAHTSPAADWMVPGLADGQTVTSDWMPIDALSIDGVAIKEIRPVPTSNGCLTEVWRAEWGLDLLPVNQVFQRLIEPGTVSGWHAHETTTDRLYCACGRIRLSLYDGRRSSRTFGAVWHRIFGAERPLLVVVPSGIWHGIKAVGSTPALVLNLVDRAYSYESPDHRRLPPDTEHIPFKLA